MKNKRYQQIIVQRSFQRTTIYANANLFQIRLVLEISHFL